MKLNPFSLEIEILWDVGLVVWGGKLTHVRFSKPTWVQIFWFGGSNPQKPTPPHVGVGPRIYPWGVGDYGRRAATRQSHVTGSRRTK